QQPEQFLHRQFGVPPVHQPRQDKGKPVVANPGDEVVFPGDLIELRGHVLQQPVAEIKPMDSVDGGEFVDIDNQQGHADFSITRLQDVPTKGKQEIAPVHQPGQLIVFHALAFNPGKVLAYSIRTHPSEVRS
ncbi:MAG: hypothetical protein ABIP44_04180, partial [Pseudoxanthomonas sp.]